SRTRPGWLIHKRLNGVEERIELRAEMTTFGRSDSCTVVIPLPIISRLHTAIELMHDRYVISDKGSANGTFVNGSQLEGPYQLSTSDEIWLGSDEIRLAFFDPEETVTLARHLRPAPLLIDDNAHVVHVYGVQSELSPLEYDLLLYLARNPGTVCTRDGCFRAVWHRSYDHQTCEDALNACIAKLRRNLRTAADSAGLDAPQITTIPRVGFRLDGDVAFTPRDGATPPRTPVVGLPTSS
ncbi:MAG: FHA domain-containing protein, partial [Roseiflexaceae bacterium]|nr:FHA domain-containing protein [Roseiflexaceae bacterium]